MKNKKKVHLGIKTFYGIFNWCDSTLRGDYANSWSEVTCKHCKNKRKARKL